jgi:hypothetical protein
MGYVTTGAAATARAQPHSKEQTGNAAVANLNYVKNMTHWRLCIPQQSPIDLAEPLVLFHFARTSLAPETSIFFLI